MDQSGTLKATSVAPVVSGFVASPSSTPTGSSPTHTCLVGANGLSFIPNEITANVGDIIEYRFYPPKHSIARAAFGNNLACAPYEDSGSDLVGFWSGYVPLSIVKPYPPVFRLRINDTDPIFFYCSSPGACQEGMIGVVNPNSTFTYNAQLQYALNTSIPFSPIRSFPAEVEVSASNTNIGSTCADTPGSCGSGLSQGAISGIVVGSFIVALLAAAAIYICGRQKTIREILRQNQPCSLNPSNAPCPNNLEAGTVHPNGPVYSSESFTTQHAPGTMEVPHPGGPIPVSTPRIHVQEIGPSAGTHSIADGMRADTQRPRGAYSGSHELSAIPEHPSPPVKVEVVQNPSRLFSIAGGYRGW